MISNLLNRFIGIGGNNTHILLSARTIVRARNQASGVCPVADYDGTIDFKTRERS